MARPRNRGFGSSAPIFFDLSILQELVAKLPDLHTLGIAFAPWTLLPKANFPDNPKVIEPCPSLKHWDILNSAAYETNPSSFYPLRWEEGTEDSLTRIAGYIKMAFPALEDIEWWEEEWRQERWATVRDHLISGDYALHEEFGGRGIRKYLRYLSVSIPW